MFNIEVKQFITVSMLIELLFCKECVFVCVTSKGQLHILCPGVNAVLLFVPLAL